MSGELVSIVMPAWNRERFIRDAITSVLQQTYPHFELIVIDDGSQDATTAIVREFTDPRVRLIEQANAGAARARNVAVAAAKGSFIAFLDSDDLWKPDKLARQMPLFERNPALTLVSGRAETIDEHGRSLHRLTDRRRSTKYDRARDWHRDLLMDGNVIMMSSAVVRRSALQEIGGFFDQRRIVSHDYELWIRLSEGRLFWVSSEVLVLYRMLEDSLLHGATTTKEFNAYLGILGMHRHRFSERQWRRRMASLYREWADCAQFQGERDATGHLWRAFQHDPFNLAIWPLAGRMLIRRALRVA
jgi:glycosyltransferase involved in cell wall biosynthesis